MMDLFDDTESPKDQSEIEAVGNQPCTQAFYFSLDEREEFRKLMKLAIMDLLSEEPTKMNLSDGLLTLLRREYGDNN